MEPEAARKRIQVVFELAMLCPVLSLELGRKPLYPVSDQVPLSHHEDSVLYNSTTGEYTG